MENYHSLSASLKNSKKSERSLAKKVRKPNSKGKDTRFSLTKDAYERIKFLEEKYNIKQSAVVKMAIDYLFYRYQSMGAKDFLIAINKEHIHYILANSGISSKRIQTIRTSLEKVLQDSVKKL